MRYIALGAEKQFSGSDLGLFPHDVRSVAAMSAQTSKYTSQSEPRLA